MTDQPPRPPAPPPGPAPGVPSADAVPSIGGSPFANGPPAQLHFARSALSVLAARDRAAITRLAAPAARDAIVALAASDDALVRAAAGSTTLRTRTDGTRTTIAFADLDASTVAVLHIHLGDDGRMVLDDVARMALRDFSTFGRPL